MTGALQVIPADTATALQVVGQGGTALTATTTDVVGTAIEATAPAAGAAVRATAATGGQAVHLEAGATAKALVANSTNPTDAAVQLFTTGPSATAHSDTSPGWSGVGVPGVQGEGVLDSSGTGVAGIGGTPNGIGVTGTGTGSGAGVQGTSGGSGPGVKAVGVGNSYGAYAQSSGSQAAMAAVANGSGPGMQGTSALGVGGKVQGGLSRVGLEATGGTQVPAILAHASDKGPSVLAWSGQADNSSATSTFQAGSTTSIVKLNATASAVDDYYVGWLITVGAGADSSIENDFRRITAYTGATQLATLDHPFGGTPSAGDAYTLTPDPAAALQGVGSPRGDGVRAIAGREAYRFTVGAVPAPTATQFKLEGSPSGTNNYYQYWAISVANRRSIVTAYDGTTKVVTVSPALPGAPLAGDGVALIGGGSALVAIGASAQSEDGGTQVWNGPAIDATGEIAVQASNPAGLRGHLWLVPSTATLPANTSLAGEFWTSTAGDQDVYYHDGTGWVNLSSVTKVVAFQTGEQGFIYDVQGTWKDQQLTVSGAAVQVAIGWDATNKRSFRRYDCTALDGSSHGRLTMGWAFILQRGFQEWTSISLDFKCDTAGKNFTVGLLDTTGSAAGLVGDTGTTTGALQTCTVTVSSGTFTSAGIVIVTLEVAPDVAFTAPVSFYGATIRYRA